ncbi:DUF58 domain-containing protein [Paenibacillus anaericanus]|uniref:DUF58 domain-containing protein n=1 Tax=Paenibacillus anaericanus TaxID=170367 RepID=A0A433Y6Y5_9BACL|nr:DUF58 domain-containing protein [Paenibacillus anaericanus]RUT45141.1 DUF58 domain-containing protein [Paenibacillus anaericanus]
MQLTWFIISVGFIVFILSLVYNSWALKGVKYSRYFSKEAVFEGEHIDMIEVITNEKLLPLPWLRLESSMASGLIFGAQGNLDIYSGETLQNHISLFYLRPYRQITRRHQITCSRRGLYRLDSVTMTTGDPLGMGGDAQKFPLALELLVYPKVIHLDELPLPNHSWIGQIAVRRWIIEDPFLTSGVTEYRPGDRLGSINWQATARTGTMQVHKRDYSADHRLMICLNIEVSDSMWKAVTEPERIELGITYAAAIAAYALRSGMETGFLCNARLVDGPKIPIRKEPQAVIDQLDLLLEVMARIVLDRSVSMIRLLEQEIEAGITGTDYLIITCHQGDKLRTTVEQLQNRGNGIEWMDIPELASVM